MVICLSAGDKWNIHPVSSCWIVWFVVYFLKQRNRAREFPVQYREVLP